MKLSVQLSIASGRVSSSLTVTTTASGACEESYLRFRLPSAKTNDQQRDPLARHIRFVGLPAVSFHGGRITSEMRGSVPYGAEKSTFKSLPIWLCHGMDLSFTDGQ